MLANKISLESISKKIDFIINGLESTEVDFDKMISAFKIENFYLFNIILSKLNYKDYLKFIDIIFDNLGENILNNNKSESEIYIRLFLNIYYFNKKFDKMVSYNILEVFINFCLLYDSKFLNSENKEILEDWLNSFKLYIENSIDFKFLKKFNDCNFLDFKNIWNQFIIGSYIRKNENIYENFIINEILLEIVKNSYELIRQNKSIIKELYNVLNNLVQYFISNEFNSSYYYRILSIITLKNDVLMQRYGINKESLNTYIYEVMFIIRNNLQDGDPESFYKLFEALGKIQLAHNLINSKFSLENVYKKLFINFINNMYLPIEYNILCYQNSYLHQFLVSGNAFKLFIYQYNKKNFYYMDAVRKCTIFWKYYKYRKYGLWGKLLFIVEFIFPEKYNFIY